LILQDSTVSSTRGYKFSAGCKPGGMLDAQSNSICRQESYGGGLQCCYHGMNLLDADQPIPPLLTTYRFRLRFHHQPYVPSVRGPRYDNAIFLFWQTEEWQTEYDVPRAPHHVAPWQAVHVLTNTFKAADMLGGFGISSWACAAMPVACLQKRRNCTYLEDGADGCGFGPARGEMPTSGAVRTLYVSMHSHVGVLSGELLNVETGELLCRIWPIIGTSDTLLDERGYAVGIVPCIWDAGGDASLPTAPVVPLNATLMAIARYNSSVGHLGVMSLWEMRGAWA